MKARGTTRDITSSRIAVHIFGVLFGAFEAFAQVGAIRVGMSSPTAAALGKYGDVPVSYYTGLPHVSVPLFELKGRTMNLPIAISYQGGGIKVEEVPGWIGMGWSLLAGGVITRTTRGLRDDATTGYLFTGGELEGTTNWPNPTQTYYDGVKGQLYDPEPDYFYFNFAGRSGRFVFGSDQKVYTIPHEKLRFIHTITGSGSSQEISKWTVTDEQGIQYIFEAVERTNDIPQGSRTEGGTNQNSITSWYLTRIVSTSGQDEFTFTYSTPINVTYSVQIYEESFHLTMGNPCNPQNVAYINNYEIGVRYLESIAGPKHSITFTAGTRSDGTGEKKLDYFTVLLQGQVVKKFVFEYDYQPGGQARLRLTKVHEEAADGSRLPSHTFSYDDSWMPARSSKAIDHWGYYNGQNSNSTLIPSLVFLGNSYPGANREPNGTTSMAGVLTKITYPTGGYTQFTYEPHDYGMIGNSFVTEGESTPYYAGAYSDNGSVQEYPFTIGGTSQTSVHIVADLDPDYAVPSVFHNVEITNSTGSQLFFRTSQDQQTDIVLDPGAYKLRAISEGAGAHAYIDISWSEIISVKTKTAGGVRIKRIEHHDGVSAANNIVKEYTYRTAADPERSSGVLVSNPKYHYWFEGFSCQYLSRSSVARGTLGTTQGSHIGYSEVTEKVGSSGQFGVNKYSYRSPFDVPDYTWAPEWWPLAPSTSQDWQRGQIERQEVVNAASSLQQMIEYAYNFAPGANYKSVRAMTFKTMIHTFAEVQTYWAPYEIIAAWYYPTSETMTSYDQNGTNPVVKTKQYFYDNPTHVQLTKTIETNSDGLQRTTEFVYAHEQYSPMNDGPAGKHMMSQFFSTTVKQGTSDVEAKTWTLWGNADGIWRAREEWVWRGDGSANDLTAPAAPGDGETYKARTYQSYDTFGNLLEERDANNVTTRYAYGHNSSLLIGEFRNIGTGNVHTDNFNDGSVTDNDPFSWTLVDGPWSASSGTLKSTFVSTHLAYAGNHTIQYQNFTTDVLVRIVDDHENPNNWAAIHFGSTSTDVFSTGYLVYYRSNGNIALYSLGYVLAGEVSTGKSLSSWRRLSVSVNDNKVQVFVDGQCFIDYTHGFALPAGYISLATYRADTEFDDFRSYPQGAVAKTYSYDPLRLFLNGTVDEGGSVARIRYDSFSRPTKELALTNGKYGLVAEHRYQFGRAVGDVFNPSRPNLIETVWFETQSGYSDFSSGDGWSHTSGVTFGIPMAGETTVRMGGPAWRSIYKAAGTGHKLARVDFYPDNTTSGTPHVLAFEGSNYRFCVQYNPGSDRFVIQRNLNGTWDNPLTLSLPAPPNRWYTVEIEKTETGETYAFAYPKGHGRIYESGYFYQTSGYPTNWNPNVQSWSDYDYYYLANHYIGLPDRTVQFTDGLGRPIQLQRQLKNTTIVTSSLTYDALGREWRSYKSYEKDFLGANRHRFDPSFAANADAYYNVMDSPESRTEGYPYSEVRYTADPMNRPSKQSAPGYLWRMDAGKEVKLSYLANTTEIPGYTGGSLFKSRRTDEDDKIVDTFTDKFGNTIASIVDPGGLNLRTQFKYDVLGNLIESEPPKGSTWKTTYAYTPLSQVRQKTSPDAGTVQYLYDKNGNLRLVKDANHTAGSANSVNINYSAGGVFTHNNNYTLNLPGSVNISVTSNSPGQTSTLKVKASNGTVLQTWVAVKQTTNGSMILPQGSYSIELTGAGGSGTTSYNLTCTTGHELIYRKYDLLDRVVQIGEYVSSSASANFTQTNADNTTFPMSSQVVQHTFYYDDPAPLATYPLATDQRNVRGRVSYVQSYRLGSLAQTALYSYDDLGRIEWISYYNLGSVPKKLKYTYDLQGRVLKKEYIDLQTSANNLFTYYEYDQVGRLTKVSTNPVDNPGTANKEAEYSYYASGAAKDLKLGSSNVQIVDYRYNARDWLSRVNDVDNIGTDRFAQRLYYAETSPLSGTTARFNGNISAMTWWNTQVPTDPRLAYRLSYDNAQRLTSSQSFVFTTSWETSDKWKEPTVAYDQNGNILSYQRYGHNAGLMDNLTYNYYTNTNGLNYITDSVPAGSYGSDLDNQSPGNYAYDNNGNMIQDLQRDIGFIIYDINNQPVSTYRKSSGQLFASAYDAKGARIRNDENGTEYYVIGADGASEAVADVGGSLKLMSIKAGSERIGEYVMQGAYNVALQYQTVTGLYEASTSVTVGPTVTVSGNATFKAGSLVRLQPGFQAATGTTFRAYIGSVSPPAASRFYYLKDHLGSIRTIVNGSGAVDGYHDFYPFGMTMEQRSLVGTADSRFRHTGQEYESQTKNYAFDYRAYDPLRGGWLSTDPIEEYGSAYVYVGNNPLRWVDWFGLMSSDTMYTADAKRFEERFGVVDVVAENKSQFYVLEYVGLELPYVFDLLFGDRSGYYGHEYFKVGGEYYKTIDLRTRFIGGIPKELAMVGGAGRAFRLTGQLKQIWSDRRLFLRWLKGNQSLVRVNKPLSHEEARQIIDNAERLGLARDIDLNPRGLSGLEQTGRWAGIPHFKIKNIHIPVHQGFKR